MLIEKSKKVSSDILTRKDLDLTSIINQEINIINDQFVSLQPQDPKNFNISLISGLSGTALINLYAGKFLANKKFTEKGYDLIAHIIKVLNDQSFIFTNFFSFCNGLTGVCFTLNHLIQNNFLKKGLEGDLEEIESFLFDMGKKSLEVGKSDFLHGGMGILYYLIKRQNGPKSKRRAEELIDAYFNAAKIDEAGLRMCNTVLLEREPKEFDLGLAHGLAGHLIILAEAYKAGLKQKKIKYIICRGLEYLESKKLNPKYTGFRGMYPVSFIEDIPVDDPKNLKFYDSRLAWCYGDLNYAILYARLGEIFKNKEYTDQAITIGLHAANRMDKESSKISNVFFCHGSSGVSNIFFEIYKVTGREEFFKASSYWLKEFLDSRERNLENLDPAVRPCLLNGSGGLVLSLLSRQHSDANSWNEIYLIK